MRLDRHNDPACARFLFNAGKLAKSRADRKIAHTKPVYAVVRSKGTILADHSFNLVGACEIEPHELFDGAQAAMLPGQ